MRYFFDAEFYEDGSTVMPISIGFVAEDGRELYLELAFDEAAVLAAPDPFVRKNVLPHLGGTHKVSQEVARNRIVDFTRPALGGERPEFWAYYASYDWLVLCQLFGRMVDLPTWMPMHPMDLQQWWVQLGRPEGAKPPKPVSEHHALADARWNRALWANLDTVASGRTDAVLQELVNMRALSHAIPDSGRFGQQRDRFLDSLDKAFNALGYKVVQ